MKLVKQILIIKIALLIAILLTIVAVDLYKDYSKSVDQKGTEVLTMATSPIKDLWNDLTNY